MKHIVLLLTVSAFFSACGASQPPAAAAPPAATSEPTSHVATTSPELTKPPSLTGQKPLAAPTHVSWGIDRGAASDGRRTFELYYDGYASGFRIVDASGALVVKVPLAGSGIFDRTTCLSEWTSKGVGHNVTWTAIDEATFQRLSASGAVLRVEVDTIGVPPVTLPLADSGCRR